MKLAGYSNISATSYMIRRGVVLSSKIKDNSSETDNSDNSKKLYIPTYLNKFRIVGCVDSGSDITILLESYFKRIFKGRTDLFKSDISNITTFSDTVVPVIGKLNCLIQLSPSHPGINLPIYVIPDIPNVPVFLLGNDMLKAGLGMIAYSGDINDPSPEILFKYPVEHKCTVYNESPKDIYFCAATCTLDPYEVREIEFFLSKAAPVRFIPIYSK